MLNQKHYVYNYFMESYYLFKLPAFVLVSGLLLIDNFIRKTNKKVAEEKAVKAAAEALKKKAKWIKYDLTCQ